MKKTYENQHAPKHLKHLRISFLFGTSHFLTVQILKVVIVLSGCILPYSTFLCGGAKQFSQIVSLPYEGWANFLFIGFIKLHEHSADFAANFPRSTMYIFYIHVFYILYHVLSNYHLSIFIPFLPHVSIFAKKSFHWTWWWRIPGRRAFVCAHWARGDFQSAHSAHPGSSTQTSWCFSPNQRLGPKQNPPFVAELQPIGRLVLNSSEAAWTSL